MLKLAFQFLYYDAQFRSWDGSHYEPGKFMDLIRKYAGYAAMLLKDNKMP